MEIDYSMYNILIVEDSELNLFVLKEILEREHFNVFTASGAKGAFENLQQQRIDLILMDVMMGETNGFDLTSELKSLELYKHIPVLFITTLKSPDDVVRGFDSGGVDYISKPFNKKELLQRIKHQIKLIESGNTIAKQTAQLQEAILNRDSMYAILAHDLRSPISSLKMILNILTMSPEGSSIGYDNMVNTGNDIAEQLFSVLDNLLKWTKNSLGVLSYMPQEIEFDEMITGVVETLQPTAKLKKIEIQLILQPGLQILFDADIMKSMLRNLLINAVKFSHEGSLIKLNLSRHGNDAMVEIIDTGVGMSMEAQRQLLDQMKEESEITPMREKGKGLGLWVVYHFIQRGGGEFFFESKENVGSRFGFRIPLMDATSNR